MSARKELPVTLSPRDRSVVELVARFRQLTAEHIRAALFADVSSKTPCDRALKRLCERRYLVRLPRLVGGVGGGGQQGCYQLGRAGWRLLERSGSYWAARTVNAHTLAIADCYVALKQAERCGALALLGFETEPTCHRAVGGIQLTPDAYAEVGIPERRLKYRLWLEVDLDSEHSSVIRQKCLRYWQAYHEWPEATFPFVVFVARDHRRREQLARISAAGPEPARALFRSSLVTDLASMIWSNL
jgi:hypothetical protein